jgi:hypothetical protein
MSLGESRLERKVATCSIPCSFEKDGPYGECRGAGRSRRRAGFRKNGFKRKLMRFAKDLLLGRWDHHSGGNPRYLGTASSPRLVPSPAD